MIGRTPDINQAKSTRDVKFTGEFQTHLENNFIDKGKNEKSALFHDYSEHSFMPLINFLDLLDGSLRNYIQIVNVVQILNETKATILLDFEDLSYGNCKILLPVRLTMLFLILSYNIIFV